MWVAKQHISESFTKKEDQNENSAMGLKELLSAKLYLGKTEMERAIAVKQFECLGISIYWMIYLARAGQWLYFHPCPT